MKSTIKRLNQIWYWINFYWSDYIDVMLNKSFLTLFIVLLTFLMIIFNNIERWGNLGIFNELFMWKIVCILRMHIGIRIRLYFDVF